MKFAGQSFDKHKWKYAVDKKKDEPPETGTLLPRLFIAFI